MKTVVEDPKNEGKLSKGPIGKERTSAHHYDLQSPHIFTTEENIALQKKLDFSSAEDLIAFAGGRGGLRGKDRRATISVDKKDNDSLSRNQIGAVTDSIQSKKSSLKKHSSIGSLHKEKRV